MTINRDSIKAPGSPLAAGKPVQPAARLAQERISGLVAVVPPSGVGRSYASRFHSGLAGLWNAVRACFSRAPGRRQARWPGVRQRWRPRRTAPAARARIDPEASQRELMDALYAAWNSRPAATTWTPWSTDCARPSGIASGTPDIRADAGCRDRKGDGQVPRLSHAGFRFLQRILAAASAPASGRGRQGAGRAAARVARQGRRCCRPSSGTWATAMPGHSPSCCWPARSRQAWPASRRMMRVPPATTLTSNRPCVPLWLCL